MKDRKIISSATGDTIPLSLSDADTPSDILRLRCMALQQGDFGLVYDSCHPESNFRKEFPLRFEYIDYARQNISGKFVLADFRILREDVDGEDARVIIFVEFLYGCQKDSYAELSSLRLTSEGWRYLCGQKLLPGQFNSDVGKVTFEDFEKVKEKLIF